MQSAIKRILQNIRWLLNHPPTNIKTLAGDTYCSYCGRTAQESGTVVTEEFIDHKKLNNEIAKNVVNAPKREQPKSLSPDQVRRTTISFSHCASCRKKALDTVLGKVDQKDVSSKEVK